MKKRNSRGPETPDTGPDTDPSVAATESPADRTAVDTDHDEALTVPEQAVDTTPAPSGESSIAGDDRIAPAPGRRTFCDVMGISLIPHTTGDELPLADDDRRSRLVGDERPVWESAGAAADVATEPLLATTTSVEARADTDGPPPSSGAPFAAQVYDDEARALKRRLQKQQFSHGRLIEKVAHGEADATDIARSRGEMRATRDALEDLTALQAHVREAEAEQAARNAVLAYHRVVDTTDAAMALALEDARAIDDSIEALGVAVGRFRERMRACDALHTALLEAGGGGLLDHVAVWSSQRTGLDPEVLNRLRCVGVLTGHGVDAVARERRVAAWLRAWAVLMIQVARQQGPALPEHDEAEEQHHD